MPYVAVPNWAFDQALPDLSASAFKVLCVIIRQTLGFREPGQTDWRRRREWDLLSYSQLAAKTGIRSDVTIHRALIELTGKGYIERRPAAHVPGTLSASYEYRLHPSYQPATENGAADQAQDPATENGAAPLQKMERHRYRKWSGTATENGDTKDNNEKQQQAVVVESAAEGTAFLMDYGLGTETAAKLADRLTLDVLHFQAAQVDSMTGVKSPAAVLTARLKSIIVGKMQPMTPAKPKKRTATADPQDRESRQAFITGEYADVIEH